MFDLHLLHLPPLNLFNINSYYSETHAERAMKSPLCFCGEKKGNEGRLKELWEGRLERMKEVLGSR